MSQPLSGEFTFTRLETVIYGPGKITMLSRQLSRHGMEHAMIVTGHTLGKSKLLDQVKGAIGDRLAGVFAEASQHVPSKTVQALVDAARDANADSFVSFGGGSPNDTTKAAAMRLMTENNREFPNIAVPTTLSAGEFTAFAGMTDETTREKGGVGDPRLQAKTVILDPILTLETPDWLWVGTAMRAMDHAVEGAYSMRNNPVSDTMSSRAIALMIAHLKPSIEVSEDQVDHREQCQLAAWFSIFGALNTRMGISHALGHQIGPTWDIPHGFTSCITLPHAMRFMANIAPERFGAIAEGLGIRFDIANPRKSALECADRVAEFIAQFDVPHRLSDAEVPRSDLSKIAGTVLNEVSRARTIDRAVTLDEVKAILEAAY
jgi:alcohol dehydrogenase class IV